MEELYLVSFLAIGCLAGAWQMFRWARKTRSARKRTLSFELSIQQAVREAHQAMLERRL